MSPEVWIAGTWLLLGLALGAAVSWQTAWGVAEAKMEAMRLRHERELEALRKRFPWRMGR